jgi:hypothetical protein
MAAAIVITSAASGFGAGCLKSWWPTPCHTAQAATNPELSKSAANIRTSIDHDTNTDTAGAAPNAAASPQQKKLRILTKRHYPKGGGSASQHHHKDDSVPEIRRMSR